MSIICTRLLIVENLSERTPLCVINEIAEAHRIGIEYNKLSDYNYVRSVVKTIYANPTYNTQLPLGSKRKALVMRYLGIRSSLDNDWSEEQLIDIYQHWKKLISMLSDININPAELCVLPLNDKIGSPTKVYPYALNACFLYRICTKLGIELPLNVSLETMSALISLYPRSNRDKISLINSIIMGDSGSVLLNMLASVPTNYLKSYIAEKSDNYTDIESIADHQKLIDITKKHNFSFGRRDPNCFTLSIPEALVYAAYNYGINLFHASDPIREYYHLRSCFSTDSSNDTSYVPKNTMMKQLYDKNPLLISLRIFDPRFPVECYKPNILAVCLELEGHTPAETHMDVNSQYELLQIAHVSQNFYQGWFPKIKNKESPFLCSSIDEVAKEDIICYGIRSESLTFCTIEELTNCFKKNGNFKNELPNYTGFYSDINIRKLKKILTNLNTDNARACILELDSIESLNTNSNLALTTLYEVHANTDIEQKKEIESTLYALFELSMTLRGWLGTGPYPIVNAPVDDQLKVDIKVSEYLAAFNTKLAGLKKELRMAIENLPLLIYQSGRFLTSNSVENGTTIGERIEIMKQGENTDNVNSCIRITSNWLAASVFRYYQTLKLQPPFNIEELRYIAN